MGEISGPRPPAWRWAGESAVNNTRGMDTPDRTPEETKDLRRSVSLSLAARTGFRGGVAGDARFLP